MKTTYEYRTMPALAVIELTAAARPQPDAYLSDDQEKQAYDKLLAGGFRWIRTDGDTAIFERAKVRYPFTPEPR
jgi:hypothetical protein